MEQNVDVDVAADLDIDFDVVEFDDRDGTESANPAKLFGGRFLANTCHSDYCVLSNFRCY